MREPCELIDFSKNETVTLRCHAVVDANGHAWSPGWLTIRCESTEECGTRTLRTVAVGNENRCPGAPVVHLDDSVVVPGFVNAHCHLDLTHVGPQPRPLTGGFSAWLEVIRHARPQEPRAIADAVRTGIELSLAGGVVAVGDIGGSPRSGPSLVPWRTLRDSPLAGVSFLEFFAIGTMREAAMNRCRQVLDEAGPDRVMLGLQPHAPYSVSQLAYQECARLAREFALPLSTHLAETLEERQFIADATGPQRAFLESLGLWASANEENTGRGNHPVQHLSDPLAAHPWVLAHLNDCSDEALDVLASTNCSVAYCPRASAYFDAADTLGPHRYRDMLNRGINVCLGTDSIVNLPNEATDATTGGISPFDDARLLYNRDQVDSTTVLAMLTTNGARALGLDPVSFTFTRGHKLSGLVAVRVEDRRATPIDALFTSGAKPQLIASGARACIEDRCE